MLGIRMTKMVAFNVMWLYMCFICQFIFSEKKDTGDHTFEKVLNNKNNSFNIYKTVIILQIRFTTIKTIQSSCIMPTIFNQTLTK